MISRTWLDGKFSLKWLALALLIWGPQESFSRCLAGGVDVVDPQTSCPAGFGTLGWGPPGCNPGFQGFGLFFHRGYGYGGDSLGVGALGGYPFYGGPGYLHQPPPLRRFGPIVPFAYYSAAGLPGAFDGPGSLVVDPPVVIQASGRDPGSPGGSEYAYNEGYGSFTGALPYPDGFFAPFTAAAAAGAFSSPPGPANPPRTAVGAAKPRDLGIDEEQVVEADGSRNIRVARVRPGTAAEKAGLKPGDIVRSINGYRTEQRGNLAWILAHAVADDILTIKVRSAIDGKERTLTARLP